MNRRSSARSITRISPSLRLRSSGHSFFFPPNGTASEEAAPHFGTEGQLEEEFEEDDGLGYYADGVKRTLTDEQIAMFRHSELETLRREQARGISRPSQDAEPSVDEDSAQLSEGEISETPAPAKKKKKRKRNNKNKPQTEGQQIDLRKRTWDVVDAGLDRLDYGDEEETTSGSANPAQRRRISYDD